MFKQIAAILASSILLTSCASQSKHEQLKRDFERHKRNCDHKTQQMQSEILSFKQNYSPQLHDQLNKNLKLASTNSKNISEILQNMQKLEIELKGYAKTSKYNCDLTANNAKTSTAKNIANEFYTLKNKWNETTIRLKNETKELQNLLEISKTKADQATTLAATTVKKANKVILNGPKSEEMRLEIDRIKLVVDQLKAQKDPNKINNDLLMELYKSVNARLLKVENK